MTLTNYHITGCFYNRQGYPFRKYLNIRKKGTHKRFPDLMVVLMNPGSSKPLDQAFIPHTEVQAKPDQTQNQIIRVMEQCNKQYARILNLSDLLEPKSLLFHATLEKLKKKKVVHSIFHPSRSEEFATLFQKTAPVILGWGVHKNLEPMAKQALAVIPTDKRVGVLKESTDWGYYHPLPPSTPKQRVWVQRICEQIL
ncbi:MAG: hypothetical protein CMB99_05845 [Flavobacteriaceae bacterium]|nr:hypothetical protein [Flavobacteriaceae bacterium]|tara:strand:- start:14017 stop:14607 length:591 start_codon:yes stop_codon:yes gene_type:complete